MKTFRITQSITNRQDESLTYYFRDISKEPLLTSEEEYRLSKLAKEGNINAINKLVKSNLRFVVSVAKQYQGNGLSLVDLIQEGNIGLIEGIKKFDPDKGFKLISYAVWWIRQSITLAISNKCRTVRVPWNRIVDLSKINKVSENFEKINHRSPSIEEIANELNCSEDKVSIALSSNNRSLSLDTPFKDEDAGCLLDIIPNKNSTLSDTHLVENSNNKVINQLLELLPYRESDVLRLSFGIDTEQLTLDEIGYRFGIGSERTRQIQNDAIRRLKTEHMNELKELI
jgi:RNA polymerase primary sigma factor